MARDVEQWRRRLAQWRPRCPDLEDEEAGVDRFGAGEDDGLEVSFLIGTARGRWDVDDAPSGMVAPSSDGGARRT